MVNVMATQLRSIPSFTGICIGTYVTLFLGLSGNVWAHPFHTSTAEMEYNAGTGRFEVALKIAASDFEQLVIGGTALIAQDQRSQETPTTAERLTKEQQREKLAARYLEKQFTVSNNGKACTFQWVGTEDEIANKWLYFEIVVPIADDENGEWILTNKVLCDHYNNQINTVVLIAKAKRVSLKTHEQSVSVALPSFK